MTGRPARLVYARVGHLRRSPLRYGFAHDGVWWLIDAGAPPRLPRGLGWLARFAAEDHFAQPGTPGETLRSRLEESLRAAGEPVPGGRVTALLAPRVAGYVFNPLSVFWCHAPDGSLGCVVAEVHNTYGGRHCYVLHPDPAGRATVAKEFYVSPFHDVTGDYRLRVPEPGPDGRVAIAVTLDRPGAEPFTATLVGRSRPATLPAVLRAQVRAPLAPWLVALRIRLHGIGLWARGLPVVPRPDSRPATRPATPTRKADR